MSKKIRHKFYVSILVTVSLTVFIKCEANFYAAAKPVATLTGAVTNDI